MSDDNESIGDILKDINKKLEATLKVEEDNHNAMLSINEGIKVINKTIDYILANNRDNNWYNPQATRSPAESTVSLTEIDSSNTLVEWSGLYTHDDKKQTKKITESSFEDFKHLDDADDTHKD